MSRAEFNVHDKIKSPMGSAETLDGFTDVEEPHRPTTRRRPNNLTIIFLLLFLAWCLVFMGVTIYQIRSYKREESGKEPKKVVRDESFKSDTKHLEIVDSFDHKETRRTEPVLKKKELKEVGVQTDDLDKEHENQVRKVVSVDGPESSSTDDSHLKRKLFVNETPGRFEDVKFVYDSENCYRKDYVRLNVNGTGVHSRLIVKSSKITDELSENFGKCATVYYWIYSKDGLEDSRIYSLGPYYGHHSVNVTEDMFESSDSRGSYTLFGCQPPLGAYETDFELNRMQTVTKGNAYITISSSKFKNILTFKKVLEERGKKEMGKYSRLIERNAHDVESVKKYTLLREASRCLHTL